MLIEFLNELLKGEHVITDINFKDKEQLAETKDHRGIIYDIFCETDTHEHIIVEMQNKYQPYFIDRSLFYASRIISTQAPKGQGWDYKLTPVYMVCFMNFDVMENQQGKFRTDVMLADKDSGTVFSDKLRFIYLIMPLFDKEADECENNFERWIYVLKHMATLERMPFEAQNKIFEKLAKIADSKTLSREDQEKYDESMRIMWDNFATMKYAVEKGMKEGREKGMKEGMKEGMKKEKIGIALNLLSLNIPIDTIISATNLTKEEIEKLQNQN